MIDLTILTNFANIRLTAKQYNLLRSLYNQTSEEDGEKEEPTVTEDGFYKPRDLGSLGVEYFWGIVPEFVLILVSLGFIDPMDPEKDPTKDDNGRKYYAITPTGVMFFMYYREKLLLNYFPAILSALSLLVSIISVIITAL